MSEAAILEMFKAADKTIFSLGLIAIFAWFFVNRSKGGGK